MRADEHTVKAWGVNLCGAKFYCPKCDAWKGAAKFGLRRMPHGEIRNQSWCVECRSSKKEAASAG